ncbi:sensor histidine kinase [Hymenobacter cheonanensis]|uniref:sensor histidine kinase n=1 Tax=Hymenobacter sp. CA2-7 TaxID=3063993 RepID=UPI00271420DD|nr:sensor histidine kinase [Hymenobacter sp. CA2-7]MDO7884905.1 sensor histidine kinase [Hymenobacter sp. CA2-7]
MPLRLLRPASTLLLHALVWGLVVVLLWAQQPDYPGPKPPEFWLTQALVFGLLVGLFYLNLNWAAPRLLYGRRLPAYLAVNVVAGLAILFLHQQAETRLHVPELVARGREAVLDPPNPWSAPRPHFAPGPAEAEGSALFDTGVLLLTLMVLGLSASLAAVQKAQRDAESRLELERRQVATELSLLKAQINPHFFFNTLNNIYALTLLDGERARAALHRLSRMMRYVLYETPAGHTRLSQEVSFLRDYIELMHLRLTDQVEVIFETPAADAVGPDPFIAPMLFQPYVENAFKHGVSASSPSRITIALRQPGPQQVEMCVRNTLFVNHQPEADEPGGIGLANTRRRLDLLYPGQYTLRVIAPTTQHEYEVCLSLHLRP